MLRKKQVISLSIISLLILTLMGLLLFIYFQSPIVSGKIISDEPSGLSSLTFTINASKNAYTLSGYNNTVAIVDIPSTFNDGINGELPVTAINANVFNGKTRLTKVTIPNTITSFGTRVFYNATSLTRIGTLIQIIVQDSILILQ